jgi:biotin operon repressor
MANLGAIEANVTKGTADDAWWLSYGTNQGHGLRRTNDDKRRAVERALQHPKGTSDEVIAEHVGVARLTVLKYRQDLEDKGTCIKHTSRQGRDGRTINTANIGKRKPDPDFVPDDVGDDEAGRYLPLAGVGLAWRIRTPSRCPGGWRGWTAPRGSNRVLGHSVI